MTLMYDGLDILNCLVKTRGTMLKSKTKTRLLGNRACDYTSNVGYMPTGKAEVRALLIIKGATTFTRHSAKNVNSTKCYSLLEIKKKKTREKSKMAILLVTTFNV